MKSKPSSKTSAKTDSKTLKVALSDIEEARQVLRKYIQPTPLLQNSWLSEAFGCELYLKMENMHPIGSFKIRGATYKISRLTKDQMKRGVVAASAGNHAQGVAWGSKKVGAKALIVMPRTAPLMKVQNTKLLGAEVLLEGDSYDQAFAAAKAIAKKSGRVLIHAFEDAEIIAGQGTLGLEILEQLPDVDVVVGSVGGGGMMAGVAVAFHELKPKALLYGAQAKGSPSMLRSLEKGSAISLDQVETFADGIAIRTASEGVRRLLAPRITQILEADDEMIAAAVLTLMEKAKVISEGAGGVALAVVEQLRSKIRGKKVVVIVSGGNIDVNVLSRIIDRGLIRTGRRLRVNVLMSDRTGSLARLTDLIAKAGANIIQTIHDRSEPSTTIDLTEVALTLETKGPEHSEAVIAALREHAIRLEIVH